MEKVTVKKFQLIRDVPMSECHWLNRDFKKGEMVYEYPLYTYGCINEETGIACSEKDSESPFFELPKDALIEYV